MTHTISLESSLIKQAFFKLFQGTLKGLLSNTIPATITGLKISHSAPLAVYGLEKPPDNNFG